MNSQGVGGNRRVFEFDAKVDRNSPHTHMNDNYVCWKFSWGLQKLSPSYFFSSLILFSSSLLFLTFRSVLTYIIFAPFAFCSPQSIVCTAFKYFATSWRSLRRSFFHVANGDGLYGSFPYAVPASIPSFIYKSYTILFLTPFRCWKYSQVL